MNPPHFSSNPANIRIRIQISLEIRIWIPGHFCLRFWSWWLSALFEQSLVFSCFTVMLLLAAGCWRRLAVSSLSQVPAGHCESAESLVIPWDPHHSAQTLQTRTATNVVTNYPTCRPINNVWAGRFSELISVLCSVSPVMAPAGSQGDLAPIGNSGYPTRIHKVILQEMTATMVLYTLPAVEVR